MAVLVLMYHSTPNKPDNAFDVGLDTFRDQVNRLVDAGTNFISFDQVNDPRLLHSGRHVAVTFDDGHGSNVAAVDHLAGLGVRPTSFIVRDWAITSRGALGGGYMDARTLRGLFDRCAIGSHGATHTGLTKLSDADLANELTSSREFLEDVTGQRVTTMSLPGGAGGGRELVASEAAGYEMVGNSVPDINRTPSISVARVVVAARHGGGYPLQLLRAPPLYWTARRARRALRGLTVWGS